MHAVKKSMHTGPAQDHRDRGDVVEPPSHRLPDRRPQHRVEGVDEVQGEYDRVRARLGFGRQDLLERLDAARSAYGALASPAAVAAAGHAELRRECKADGPRRQPAQHRPARDRPDPASALRERDEHRAEVSLDGVGERLPDEEANQHDARGAQCCPMLDARVRRPGA